jgi:uncharacterized protein YecE (DUF72 family)
MKDDRDVFVYFNNDAFGYALANARELAGIMGPTRKTTTARSEYDL